MLYRDVRCSSAGLMLYDGEYFEDLKHGHGGLNALVLDP